MTIKRSKVSFRTLIAGAAFLGVMAFGSFQAIATGGATPVQGKGTCSTICKPECGSFGGTYKAGKCYCCG